MTTPAARLIRAEIEATGPITFARFMELALAHPEHGYYASGPARTTRSGDFLTAPELHPIFGAALARQLAETWERLGRPEPFVVREDGAGSGTLGLAIVEGLRADGSGLAAALRYLPRELSRARRAECAERFAAAGLAALLAESAGGEAPDPVRPFAGAVLANEFLDALPVHLVERRGGALREVLVAVDSAGEFVERLGPPSTPALAARLGELGVELAEGRRAEICLGLAPWADSVAADLGQGLVLVIDYGREAPELYDQRRMAGTLMTYRGHAADPAPEAPYRDVGERDITAHLDLTTLRGLLTARGFAHLGTTSQAELLAGCGLDDLLERERGRARDLQAAFELRAAVQRLLDPRRMGGFRALLAGRGIGPEPPLRGLSFRLERREAGEVPGG
jgi:SAM-dependent MidA family methyltransferase